MRSKASARKVKQQAQSVVFGPGRAGGGVVIDGTSREPCGAGDAHVHDQVWGYISVYATVTHQAADLTTMYSSV